MFRTLIADRDGSSFVVSASLFDRIDHGSGPSPWYRGWYGSDDPCAIPESRDFLEKIEDRVGSEIEEYARRLELTMYYAKDEPGTLDVLELSIEEGPTDPLMTDALRFKNIGLGDLLAPDNVPARHRPGVAAMMRRIADRLDEN